ncbi:MAG: type II secretion system F family protein [Acidimicrobiales bacterium]
MTGALVVGLLTGTGIILLVSGLTPMPAPLASELAALHRRPSIARRDASGPRTKRARLIGDPLGNTRAGRQVANRLAGDLRVTETSLAEHLADRAALALCGLFWAPVTAAMLRLAGADIGFTLPLWASLLLAPAGAVYPAVVLRGRAADRRRSFRHALSAFLDIVAVSLAGGRGVDSALRDGANAGQGWAFEALRSTLLEAQLLGETPWSGLARLGNDLGVPELGELAASAALAGSEGARVRGSLAAKARSLRLRGLTEVESSAHSASELMSVPVVLLMFGFVVFLGYPAIVRVLEGI